MSVSRADKKLISHRVRFFPPRDWRAARRGVGKARPPRARDARRSGRSLRKVATARDARPHTRCSLIANEPRNLRLGRAQSHISFGPVTEKNVEQVDPPWPRPQ